MNYKERKKAQGGTPQGASELKAMLYDYYVHRNSGGAVFVKEAAFFASQGGLTEPWGAGVEAY